jgi:hypothetical protein
MRRELKAYSLDHVVDLSGGTNDFLRRAAAAACSQRVACGSRAMMMMQSKTDGCSHHLEVDRQDTQEVNAGRSLGGDVPNSAADSTATFSLQSKLHRHRYDPNVVNIGNVDRLFTEPDDARYVEAPRCLICSAAPRSRDT